MSVRRSTCGVWVIVSALGLVMTAGSGTAVAAGGNGVSGCSVAGNPATDPNPGSMVREHQPFGGNGNDGSNPGFNFAGFSGCKP
ncbi:MAG: hypothetical protein Q8R60_19515 [Mycobacteriales bacterium]|nr:hypothetical protein [Mycobacteriales bacterium]